LKHAFNIDTTLTLLTISSEFGKEAMSNQSLDQGEILCIRWAHDDPNPVAQDAIDRANRDALFAIMQAKGITMEKAGFEYPLDYSVPDAKKMRLENGIDVTSQFPELAYPNTDAQYSATGGDTQSTPSMTPEQYQAYCQAYYAQQANKQSSDQAPTDVTSVAISASLSASGPSETQGDAAAAWVKCVDEDTGATYYFNDITQESSWGIPLGYTEKNEQE
jgi:hypothetical protein